MPIMPVRVRLNGVPWSERGPRGFSVGDEGVWEREVLQEHVDAYAKITGDPSHARGCRQMLTDAASCLSTPCNHCAHAQLLPPQDRKVAIALIFIIHVRVMLQELY